MIFQEGPKLPTAGKDRAPNKGFRTNDLHIQEDFRHITYILLSRAKELLKNYIKICPNFLRLLHGIAIHEWHNSYPEVHVDYRWDKLTSNFKIKT